MNASRYPGGPSHSFDLADLEAWAPEGNAEKTWCGARAHVCVPVGGWQRRPVELEEL